MELIFYNARQCLVRDLLTCRGNRDGDPERPKRLMEVELNCPSLKSLMTVGWISLVIPIAFGVLRPRPAPEAKPIQRPLLDRLQVCQILLQSARDAEESALALECFAHDLTPPGDAGRQTRNSSRLNREHRSRQKTFEFKMRDAVRKAEPAKFAPDTLRKELFQDLIRRRIR